MRKLTLREICMETGVSRRTVQGYENAGLVSPIGKNKYGHLLYDEDGLERIRHLRFMQMLQFSLREIREIEKASPYRQKELLIQQVILLEKHREELSEVIHLTNQYIETL